MVGPPSDFSDGGFFVFQMFTEQRNKLLEGD